MAQDEELAAITIACIICRTPICQAKRPGGNLLVYGSGMDTVRVAQALTKDWKLLEI